MRQTKSPCVNECIYDDRLGFCKSCGRTLEEIARWSISSSLYKKESLALAKNRLNGEDDEHVPITT